MTIRIKDRPYPIYKSSTDIDSNAMDAADKLDRKIKETISDLEKQYNKLKIEGVKKKDIYRSLGKRLLEIEKTVPPEDRKWLDVAYKKNISENSIFNTMMGRGKSRSIFNYCTFMARVSEDIFECWNYSSWANLYESISLYNDPRFFNWLSLSFEKIKNFEDGKKKQFPSVRSLIIYFNQHVSKKGRDFSLFSDKEYFDLYDKTLSDYLKKGE